MKCLVPMREAPGGMLSISATLAFHRRLEPVNHVTAVLPAATPQVEAMPLRFAATANSRGLPCKQKKRNAPSTGFSITPSLSSGSEPAEFRKGGHMKVAMPNY